MSDLKTERNKAIVLEAFDTLFNKRDYTAAKRFWSERYIQHSAHIAPGREGLFDLIRSLPETLRYENQLIVAEGDYVIVHGRFSGHGRPAAWIAADVLPSITSSTPSIRTCCRSWANVRPWPPNRPGHNWMPAHTNEHALHTSD